MPCFKEAVGHGYALLSVCLFPGPAILSPPAFALMSLVITPAVASPSHRSASPAEGEGEKTHLQSCTEVPSKVPSAFMGVCVEGVGVCVMLKLPIWPKQRTRSP